MDMEASEAAESRFAVGFLWAFLFSMVAAHSPMTAKAVHANRRSASWVVTFHLSSKFHSASMAASFYVSERGNLLHGDICMAYGFTWDPPPRAGLEGSMWSCSAMGFLLVL